MTSITKKEVLEKLGSGKLHEVKYIEIEIDDIGENYVCLSIYAINKFGKFLISENLCHHGLSTKDTVKIISDKNFKVKQRVNIS